MGGGALAGSKGGGEWQSRAQILLPSQCEWYAASRGLKSSWPPVGSTISGSPYLPLLHGERKGPGLELLASPSTRQLLSGLLGLEHGDFLMWSKARTKRGRGEQQGAGSQAEARKDGNCARSVGTGRNQPSQPDRRSCGLRCRNPQTMNFAIFGPARQEARPTQPFLPQAGRSEEPGCPGNRHVAATRACM